MVFFPLLHAVECIKSVVISPNLKYIACIETRTGKTQDQVRNELASEANGCNFGLGYYLQHPDREYRANVVFRGRTTNSDQLNRVQVCSVLKMIVRF